MLKTPVLPEAKLGFLDSLKRRLMPSLLSRFGKNRWIPWGYFVNWNLPAGAKSGRPQKASVPSETEGMSGEPQKAKENEKENGKKMERRFFWRASRPAGV